MLRVVGPRIRRPSWRRLVPLVPLVWSCGTSGGRQASGQLASALLNGVARGGSQGPGAARLGGDGPHCPLWKEHGRVCPALLSCAALSGETAPARINACVKRGEGRLRPIAGCQDQARGRWCVVGTFPVCAGLTGQGCTEFDALVCARDDGRLGLLECCAGGVEACEQDTYVQVLLGSEQGGAAEPAPAADAGPSPLDASTEDAS